MLHQKTFIPERRRHKGYSFRIPFGGGRFIWTRDPGESRAFASEFFATKVLAAHRDGDGKLINTHDLGSGTVTNVGVQALSNDWNWAQNVQTLKLANWHASGTGVTASAATDIALQTSAGPSPQSGAQSTAFTANTAVYKTSATLNYTGTLAITEWTLNSSGTLSASTGSPFTATSSVSGTVTGTPFSASSASVQGETGLIVVSGTVYGLITSNTTSVLNIPAWWSTTTGSVGSTPSGTAAYTLQPVVFDHLVFSAINVVNGDSITFNFSLTCNSGG